MNSLDEHYPIYLQIMNDIKKKIAKGEISPGERLASVRDMAIVYTVNPNTMQRVYQELEREGVINTKRGMGSFVTEDEGRVRNIRDSMARELIENFIKEMNGLGFAYKEIASMIEIYCREEMGTNE
ncbi:GntR family transcriptional regulator [Calorimonas adulescens]|uniref:GntR family transcriptional regulator n=1 Tax=Calorimonas adulescens TaxID=2606906 RepID=A0A5D8QGC4_9THEO|nr:GntR family transcriptional regulator [Calorimonas adulescens]TZE82573.1 GntR family transcriptional regulator [Calorimonas adulescens]